MNLLSITLWVVCMLQSSCAPPVAPTKEKQNESDHLADADLEVGGLEEHMEYKRYLKEVLVALESDEKFSEKVKTAKESDIRSGKIADNLRFVSPNIRTRLDEIKRVELNRLRELMEKQRLLMENKIDLDDPAHHGHLDHSNPNTFEIEDLRKLISKTTADLAEADKRRREEFKQYELNKEFEKQNKLNHSNGTQREMLEKEYKESEEKHRKHEKLHEPGHKAQLQEVWEEQDQMQQEFNPKTFFMLHDIDGNSLWDQEEVKALFIKELEKMYAAGHPEDDMRERIEEMERMRERVFEEVDLNRDGFIDYEEFLAQTKSNDFQQDHGWQGLDENRPYTDEELQEYIKQHQMSQDYPSVQQVHPGQVPQHHRQQLYGQVNPNEFYPNQQETYQQQQQQQQHSQQGQYPHQAPPQVNYHHQQIPNPPPVQQGYQQQPLQNHKAPPNNEPISNKQSQQQLHQNNEQKQNIPNAEVPQVKIL